jgi:hypothetical protein
VLVVVNKVDLLSSNNVSALNLTADNTRLHQLIHGDRPLTKAVLNGSCSIDNIQALWKQRLPNAGKISPMLF